jgi:glucodextranase-like protein
VRPVKPDPYRVRQHRGIDARRRSLPLPTRLLLGLSVVALGGAVFLTASGGLGPLVSTLGAGFSSAFGRLITTPIPSASQIIATNSPIIDPPTSPYSRVASVDLQVTVPADIVGSTDAKLRVYVALQGLAAAPIQDVAIGSSINMTVSVTLTKGRNDFTATIVRGGVESEASPVVSITFDKDPPKITVKSPKAGSTVNTPTVQIAGTTEARTTLIARNGANGTSSTAVAAADGTFTIVLPLEPGVNAIHIDATDLAGNTSGLDVSYTQGSGKMGANLIASVYRISASHHPASLQLTVIVTDPTGAPLAGASAFFTLQIPGLGPISGQATTGADGRASFTTPLVGALGTGNGQATVLVTHPVFGQVTDRVGLVFIA